ncbi:MAG: D-glycero-beta-D-manno-heptose-7-phosphate kinase [Candidatus Poribacteria bacterium]|nr:D-glycero-beta-D-manno-heptose-7-phosphate kinase [Candidatus Poribacteria bacterium]
MARAQTFIRKPMGLVLDVSPKGSDKIVSWQPTMRDRSGTERRVNLQTVFDQVKEKYIVIIGDVILDQYIWGDVNRISPEAPVPVLEVTSETTRFGGAANVAHNIASLGGKVDLIGVVGDDSNGVTLTRLLQAAGIHTAGICIDKNRPTSTKTRVIALHQQLVRIDRESKMPVDASLQGQLLKAAMDRIPQADAIIFEDYDKGVVSGELIQGVLRQARESHTPVVVDPKVENFWNYKGVTAITPNHKEAGAALNRQITDEVSLIEVGQEILDRLDLEGLLITRGEQGMSLFRRDGEQQQFCVDHIPTQPREVFDVTGAGDTVVAVFALALAAHADMLDAARLANFAGGIVVREIGCVAVTPEELSQVIRLEARDEDHLP